MSPVRSAGEGVALRLTGRAGQAASASLVGEFVDGVDAAWARVVPPLVAAHCNVVCVGGLRCERVPEAKVDGDLGPAAGADAAGVAARVRRACTTSDQRLCELAQQHSNGGRVSETHR